MEDVDAVGRTLIGAGGTFSSVILRDVSGALSIVVAVLTSVYLTVSIIKKVREMKKENN